MLMVALAGPVNVPLVQSELVRAKRLGLNPEWLYQAVLEGAPERSRPHLPDYAEVAPA